MNFQITGEAPIEKLPEHILVEILRYLSMKDRCRAVRVCKYWSKLLYSDSLWSHVDLLEFPVGLQTLWRLVRTRFSPRMSTLKLRGYDPIDGCIAFKWDEDQDESLSDAVLKGIAARCPNLQVLHLQDCHTKNISFKSLPTSIVCLEMVHCFFKRRWIAGKQNHLPKLQHLKLDNSLKVEDALIIDISVWRNLKYLSISKSCVGNVSVKTIANNLFELEYLNICGTEIEDDAVYHIAQHLKKLRQLCLAKCHRVTDNGLVKIATGLPVLNKLDISYCRQITMRGLRTLFGGSIRELIVVGLFMSYNEKLALKMGFDVIRFR
ncbi:hypothetical protein BsWGS_19941 [Bradybaena similaris]